MSLIEGTSAKKREGYQNSKTVHERRTNRSAVLIWTTYRERIGRIVMERGQ